MSQIRSNIFVDNGGGDGVKQGDNDVAPVVFVHSLAGNTRQWSEQLRHLRATRRALALDLRGHGQSPPPVDGDYSLDALARDVQTVVDQLELQRFVLVGHSMGGGVAVAYAGRHPKRVAGLLLVDPAGDSTQVPAEDASGFLSALASDAYTNVIEEYWTQILSGSTASTQEQVMADLRTTPEATVVSVLNELFGYNPVPALQRYDGPQRTIITPLNDNPFALHQLVPDLPHVLITGTGHWLHMDKPADFNRIMDDFLALIDAANG